MILMTERSSKERTQDRREHEEKGEMASKKEKGREMRRMDAREPFLSTTLCAFLVPLRKNYERYKRYGRG